MKYSSSYRDESLTIRRLKCPKDLASFHRFNKFLNALPLFLAHRDNGKPR
jgi:hypothetical protein